MSYDEMLKKVDRVLEARRRSNSIAKGAVRPRNAEGAGERTRENNANNAGLKIYNSGGGGGGSSHGVDINAEKIARRAKLRLPESPVYGLTVLNTPHPKVWYAAYDDEGELQPTRTPDTNDERNLMPGRYIEDPETGFPVADWSVPPRRIPWEFAQLLDPVTKDPIPYEIEMEQVLDKKGKPVLDRFGKPKLRYARDENGSYKPVIGEDGKPKLLPLSESGKQTFQTRNVTGVESFGSEKDAGREADLDSMNRWLMENDPDYVPMTEETLEGIRERNMEARKAGKRFDRSIDAQLELLLALDAISRATTGDSVVDRSRWDADERSTGLEDLPPHIRDSVIEADNMFSGSLVPRNRAGTGGGDRGFNIGDGKVAPHENEGPGAIEGWYRNDLRSALVRMANSLIDTPGEMDRYTEGLEDREAAAWDRYQRRMHPEWYGKRPGGDGNLAERRNTLEEKTADYEKAVEAAQKALDEAEAGLIAARKAARSQKLTGDAYKAAIEGAKSTYEKAQSALEKAQYWQDYNRSSIEALDTTFQNAGAAWNKESGAIKDSAMGHFGADKDEAKAIVENLVKNNAIWATLFNQQPDDAERLMETAAQLVMSMPQEARKRLVSEGVFDPGARVPYRNKSGWTRSDSQRSLLVNEVIEQWEDAADMMLSTAKKRAAVKAFLDYAQQLAAGKVNKPGELEWFTEKGYGIPKDMREAAMILANERGQYTRALEEQARDFRNSEIRDIISGAMEERAGKYGASSVDDLIGLANQANSLWADYKGAGKGAMANGVDTTLDVRSAAGRKLQEFMDAHGLDLDGIKDLVKVRGFNEAFGPNGQRIADARKEVAELGGDVNDEGAVLERLLHNLSKKIETTAAILMDENPEVLDNKRLMSQVKSTLNALDKLSITPQGAAYAKLHEQLSALKASRDAGFDPPESIDLDMGALVPESFDESGRYIPGADLDDFKNEKRRKDPDPTNPDRRVITVRRNNLENPYEYKREAAPDQSTWLRRLFPHSSKVYDKTGAPYNPDSSIRAGEPQRQVPNEEHPDLPAVPPKSDFVPQTRPEVTPEEQAIAQYLNGQRIEEEGRTEREAEAKERRKADAEQGVRLGARAVNEGAPIEVPEAEHEAPADIPTGWYKGFDQSRMYTQDDLENFYQKERDKAKGRPEDSPHASRGETPPSILRREDWREEWKEKRAKDLFRRVQAFAQGKQAGYIPTREDVEDWGGYMTGVEGLEDLDWALLDGYSRNYEGRGLPELFHAKNGGESNWTYVPLLMNYYKDQYTKNPDSGFVPSRRWIPAGKPVTDKREAHPWLKEPLPDKEFKKPEEKKKDIRTVTPEAPEPDLITPSKRDKLGAAVEDAVNQDPIFDMTPEEARERTGQPETIETKKSKEITRMSDMKDMSIADMMQSIAKKQGKAGHPYGSGWMVMPYAAPVVHQGEGRQAPMPGHVPDATKTNDEGSSSKKLDMPKGVSPSDVRKSDEEEAGTPAE